MGAIRQELCEVFRSSNFVDYVEEILESRLKEVTSSVKVGKFMFAENDTGGIPWVYFGGDKGIGLNGRMLAELEKVLMEFFSKYYPEKDINGILGGLEL